MTYLPRRETLSVRDWTRKRSRGDTRGCGRPRRSRGRPAAAAARPSRWTLDELQKARNWDCLSFKRMQLFNTIFEHIRRICSPGFLTSEKRPRYRDRELLPPLFLLLLEAEDEAGSAASASVVKLTCTWSICQEYSQKPSYAIADFLWMQNLHRRN